MRNNQMKKAVALKYDKENDVSPKVTASGKGKVADNMIRKAQEHNVLIQQDQSLVELLSEININQHIPEELYQAVAEVFAFVYQVDKDTSKK